MVIKAQSSPVRLLANGNFRRLWLARGLTNVGDTFYIIAVMWLIKEAGTPMMSGLAGTLLNIPPMLSLFIGVVVERHEPRRVIIWALAANLIVVVLVSAGVLSNVLGLWFVIVSIFLSAFIAQFVYPASHKLVTRLIEPEMLVNANSLQAFVNQTTEILANAAGGILVAGIGSALLIAVDVPIFAVAIFLLLGMRMIPQSVDAVPEDSPQSVDTVSEDNPGSVDAIPEDSPQSADAVLEVNPGQTGSEGIGKLKRFWIDFCEGVSFLFHDRVLMTFVIVAAASNLSWGSFSVMLPWWISGAGGTAAHYGLFNSAMAAGAVLGSLLAPFLLARKPAGHVFTACLVLDLVCFSIFPMAGLAGGGILIFAFGLMHPAVNIVVISGLQYRTPDRLQARVSSAFMGFGCIFMPVGSLLAGLFSGLIAPSFVLLSMGLFALIAVLPFALNQRVLSLDLPKVQPGGEQKKG